MNSIEIISLIDKASSLLHKNEDAKTFKNQFAEIKTAISSIPGHEDLVNVNSLDTLEEWQLSELRNTLIEQLAKTKNTWVALKKTGVDN